ncbi:MAG: homoserine O-acetyltransferase family protein [Marinifilaceae bacterium]
MKYEHFNEELVLESGAVLPSLTIAYHTYGKLSAAKDNVIWVCHALTANSDVADWWPHTVEKDCFLDPDKWFVVCANFISSPYGTTSPISVNPATGQKWYNDFPEITVRDMVAGHRKLAQRLGITQVELLVGSSIGGFQAMEWAIADTTFAKRIALIATCVKSSAWAIAFNESQRMAILADNSYGERSDNAGASGMSAARSVALLSYRGATAYNATQTDNEEKLQGYRATTYQQHQGEKLRRRFNAYSYYRLTQAVDSHNVGRSRGSIEQALQQIQSRCLVVAITSDILFPPQDHDIIVNNVPGVEYHLIDSPFGHDGFLVEHEKLNNIIINFMNTKL